MPDSKSGLVRNLLPIALKLSATQAFRDNAKLAAMSPEDRELAANAYEALALLTVSDNAKLAMSRFKPGDTVTLTSDEYASLDLRVGATGTIVAVYHNGQCAAYEVGFHDSTGDEFGLSCDEDELTVA